MKRLLITGGSSYLGRHLVPAAVERYEVRYTYFANDPLALEIGVQLDLRDLDAVHSLVDSFRPQAIIHTAGSNRSPDMETVIVEGATHIVAAGDRCQARLIHLSSDVVFDGRQAPYREDDPVSPLHAYGRAKARAESIVAGYVDQVTVRTSLIYGLGIMDRSTEWIAASLRAGRQVTLFEDQWRNPIWAGSLSRACLELVELGYGGTLNVAGAQEMTRAEFGLKLLDWWAIEERAGLQSGHSDERWPRDCRLDISLARRLLSTRLPGVDEVMATRARDGG
ncbi:MAG: sugar nucleotide-binding protein [Chloroflexota bacterium]|nr:MAG: sugar nucleotide-binding protein [Chloroflexota bacterium]